LFSEFSLYFARGRSRPLLEQLLLFLSDLLPLSATLTILVHLLLHGILVDLHLGHILLLDHVDHFHFLNLLVFRSKLLHCLVVLLAIEFIRIYCCGCRIGALLVWVLRSLGVGSNVELGAVRRGLRGRGRTGVLTLRLLIHSGPVPYSRLIYVGFNKVHF